MLKRLLGPIWELLYGNRREQNGVAQYFRPAKWFEINGRFVDGVIGVIETAHLGRWLVKTEGWIPSQHNPHSVYQVFGWPLDPQGRDWASRHGLFYSCFPGVAARYSEGDTFNISHQDGQPELDKLDVWPVPGDKAKEQERNAVAALRRMMAVDLAPNALLDELPFHSDGSNVTLAEPLPLYEMPSRSKVRAKYIALRIRLWIIKRFPYATRMKLYNLFNQSPALKAFGAQLAPTKR